METIHEMRDRARRCREAARQARRDDFALIMREEAAELERRADSLEHICSLRRTVLGNVA
jgi:hypothetical protein